MLGLGRKKSKEIAKERVLNTIQEDSMDVQAKEVLGNEEIVEEIETPSPKGMELEEYIYNLEELFDVFQTIQTQGEKNTQLMELCESINALIDDSTINFSKRLTLRELRYFIYKCISVIYQENYKDTVDDLNAKKEEVQELITEKTQYMDKMSKLKEELEDLNKDYNEIVLSNQNDLTNLATAKDEIEKLKSELEVAKDKAPDEDAEKVYKDLIDSYKLLQSEMEKKEAEIEEKNSNIQELETIITGKSQALESLNSQIPVINEQMAGLKQANDKYLENIKDLEDRNKFLVDKIKELEKEHEAAITNNVSDDADAELQEKLCNLVEQVKAKDVEIAKLVSEIRGLNLEIKKRERDLLITNPNTELISELEQSLKTSGEFVEHLTDENFELLKLKQKLENENKIQKLKIENLESRNASLEKRVSAFISGDVVETDSDEIKETAEALAQAVQPFDKERAELLLTIGFRLAFVLKKFRPDAPRNAALLFGAILDRIDDFTSSNVDNTLEEVFEDYIR